MRSKKVSREIMAGAGRDNIKAGEPKLELTEPRNGLAKAASARVFQVMNAS